MAEAQYKKNGKNADMLLILLLLAGLSVFFHGKTALKMLAACTAASVFIDFTGTYIIAKKNPLTDLSAVMTGLSTALMLSPGAPLFLGISASALSVLAGRLPFAKKGNYTFAPAVIGITAAGLIFPGLYYNFPAGETILQMLQAEKSINLTLPGIINIITGNVPGAMGTASAVFILAALIFLAVRRPFILLSSLSYIGVITVFAAVFPRVYSGAAASVIMELSAGSVLFCGVLMLNYPSVELKALPSVFYGIFTGGIYIILSRYTAVYDAAPAAVLISGILYTIIALIPPKKRKAVTENEEEQEIQ